MPVEPEVDELEEELDELVELVAEVVPLVVAEVVPEEPGLSSCRCRPCPASAAVATPT